LLSIYLNLKVKIYSVGHCDIHFVLSKNALDHPYLLISFYRPIWSFMNISQSGLFCDCKSSFQGGTVRCFWCFLVSSALGGGCDQAPLSFSYCVYCDVIVCIFHFCYWFWMFSHSNYPMASFLCVRWFRSHLGLILHHDCTFAFVEVSSIYW